MENEKDLKIDLLVPGTALREGLKIISESGTGAFIVVGSSAKLDKISTGGFTLDNSEFSSNKLAELAKMDGAII